MGVASLLDPLNTILRASENPYRSPEACTSIDAYGHGAADMWSVGAIAHALLIGQPPPSSEDTGWSIMAHMGGSRALEELWEERSEMSRDFVERLLRSTVERPTPAKALQHPWLKGVVPISSVNWQADNGVTRQIRYKTLCYMLAVLLLPVLVPFRDFEQLRVAFFERDNDHDGYVPRHVVQKVLLNRCAFTEAVNAAISIADVERQMFLICALLLVQMSLPESSLQQVQPSSPLQIPSKHQILQNE